MRLFFSVLALVTACNTAMPPQEVPSIEDQIVTPTAVVEATPTEVHKDIEPEPVIDEVKDCPSQIVNQDLLARTMSALADHSNRKKFIFWQNDYGNDNQNPVNIRVVYVYKGVRYTLWNNPTEHEMLDVGGGKLVPVTHDGWISVWERPNGSRGQKAMDTYSDENFTGCANFAIGDESRYGEDQHYMRWHTEIGDNLNEQYHGDWQSKYAQAIEGLAYTLGVK